MPNIDIIFFGTPEFSVIILEELKAKGYLPVLVITTPDKPVGRKLVLTPPPTKVWAHANNIPVLQPQSLRIETITEEIRSYIKNPSLFIVAAYGKLIPESILAIPEHQTLNVHPSLLPKLRGPSPIQSAILDETETGVSIMVVDAEMDHGPIIAQEKTTDIEWPPYVDILESTLAHQGGVLLSRILPKWIESHIAIEQDHSKATFCKKIEKHNGEINLSEDPQKNLRKIRAFRMWPYAYFFTERNGKRIRVLITEARLVDGVLVLDKVIPEGKKEMTFEAFMHGSSKSLK